MSRDGTIREHRLDGSNLTDDLPLGYALIGADGAILAWTGGAVRCAGRGPAPRTPTTLAALFPEPGHTDWVGGITRAAEGDSPSVEFATLGLPARTRLDAEAGLTPEGDPIVLLRFCNAPAPGVPLGQAAVFRIDTDGHIAALNETAPVLARFAGIRRSAADLLPAIDERQRARVTGTRTLRFRHDCNGLRLDWVVQADAAVDGALIAVGTPVVERHEENRLLRHMPVPVAHLDGNGGLLYANDALRTLLGCGDATENPRELFVDPAEARLLIQRVDESTAERTGFTTRWRHRDGHSVPVRLWASSLREHRWRPREIVVSVEATPETTDDNRAEDVNARYRTMARITSSAVIVLDEAGTIRDWNPAAERITGYRWLEAADRPLAELIAPTGMQEAFHARLLGWFRADAIEGEEVDFVDQDGVSGTLRCNAARTGGPDGPASLVIVAQQRSPLAEGGDGIRWVEQHLRSLYHNAADGLFQARLDGRLHQLNPALANLLGYRSPASALRDGAELARLFADPATYERSLERVRRGETIESLEQRIQTVDGRTVWARLTLRRTTHSGESVVEGSASDITDTRETADRLHYLLRHDGLTGVANRHEFQQQLQRWVQEVDSHQRRCMALLLLDLDRFQDLNDHFGHRYGDALLRSLAGELHNWLRHEDLLARLGGDEFALLLSDPTGIEDVGAVARDILLWLARPRVVLDQEFALTGSIGVTLYPDDFVAGAQPPDADQQLFLNADLALNHAKGDGRNTYRFFRPAMQAELGQRRALEAALRQAVEQRELSVVYQPIVRVDTGATVGVEALCRWEAPGIGPVAPAEFIPIAERLGLIEQLGEWIMETGCADLMRWGVADATLAVNVSPQELIQTGLEERIDRILARTGVAAQRLTLEITEGMVIVQPERVHRRLQALRERGIRIAVDDFGTGYSALAYLKDLPVDALKIDRSFVQPLLQSQRNERIIHAVVELAHGLDLTVIAEGVEDSATLDRLAAQGVEFVQGFHVGEPMSRESIALWLAGCGKPD